jgi:predicted dehydrogenase
MAKHDEQIISRRELLGNSALALGIFASATSGLRAEELIPEMVLPQNAPPPAPVTVAVVGLGDRGRDIMTSLSYVPGVTVAYVCDAYAGMHKKALELSPKAKAVTDYKQVLDDKTVQGVFVATATHQHKQIVLDALAAGKHVFCETPIAHTVEDAKAIALAAKAVAPKQVFQAGLQYRTNPQHHHVLKFVRTGALSTVAQAKACWHKKTSWRRVAPTDERQRALNWRLDKEISPGMIGELGIHQIDVASWFLNKKPVSVYGFGNIVAWKDGRDVADTVQAIVEYPGGVHLAYDATLANSFDGIYELFQGTDAAVMLRDVRAWMFKEADATALGWEVYAYKEKVGDDTGIALVADATKLLADGKEPGKNRDTDPRKTPLYFACEWFANDIRAVGKPKTEEEDKGWSSGYVEGYEATVIALKANEAVKTGTRVMFTPDLFTL